MGTLKVQAPAESCARSLNVSRVAPTSTPPKTHCQFSTVLEIVFLGRGGRGRGERGREGERREGQRLILKYQFTQCTAGKPGVYRAEDPAESQQAMALKAVWKGIQLFLLQPAVLWMKPTHITEGNLFDPRSTNLNINHICFHNKARMV